MKYPIPNTFGISAYCSQLIEFCSEEELSDVLPLVRMYSEQGKMLLIGRGSNLLPVSDYEGAVVRSRIMGREATSCSNGDVLVRCGSGETVDDVIEWCVAQSYYGMENLSLIPGEVGASAVQNIGAYGVEAKDVIETIEAVEISTGDKVTISNADCNYAYRYSKFKDEWKNRFVITYVTYRLSSTFISHLDYGNIRQTLTERNIDNPNAQQLRNAIIEIRRNKLPDFEVEGNAGSFFMNPVVLSDKYEELAKAYPGMPHYKVDETHEKIPAGWMIDQCGWKGRTIGNVGVHAKQALVLVNRGGAKGEEVVALCNMIRNDVKEKFGIDIYPEVNIVGM